MVRERHNEHGFYMETTAKNVNSMGVRLKAMRLQHGMTQTMLANEVDCSIGTISRIETAETLDGVSTVVVRDICQRFDCSIDWLVNGIGPSPISEGSPIDAVLGDLQLDGLDSLRAYHFTDYKNLRHVMVTCDDNWLKYRIGEVIVIDCSAAPGNGDEAIAMVDGKVQLMRMVKTTGNMHLVEQQDGSRKLFDPTRAAWFGAVSGTLSSGRVRRLTEAGDGD